MADPKQENERATRENRDEHAHAEPQARSRVVRGTHSAAEGYSKGGTGAGDPLAGIRTDESEQSGRQAPSKEPSKERPAEDVARERAAEQKSAREEGEG